MYIKKRADTLFGQNVEIFVLLTQQCSGDQIDKNGMGGKCSMYGERKGVYRVLVGKPEGKRPLGRPRCRCEDNIKMDLQKVGCGGVD